MISVPEPRVPWILFGITLAVVLGFVIFGFVICHRHGSARQLVFPPIQSKDSRQPEPVSGQVTEVENEPGHDGTDVVQYENLKDKVLRLFTGPGYRKKDGHIVPQIM